MYLSSLFTIVLTFTQLSAILAVPGMCSLPYELYCNSAAHILVVAKSEAEAGSVYIPNGDGTEDVAELW